MHKHLLIFLTSVLLFLGIQTVSAQNKPDKRPPRVARFITVGFKPINLFNDKIRLNEFGLGYEQFVSKNTSIFGGATYGAGNIYIKDVFGNTLSQFKQRRYTIYTGLRQRLLNKGKLSFFGELQAGLRREEVPTERKSIRNVGFFGLGVGLEYRISSRVKATLGINSQYGSSLGFESSLNPGLQIRLGK